MPDPERSPRRVLVVDDDPTILRLLARLLTGAGFDVRTAADGLAALAEVAAWPPDVVLTDVAMPGLDGIRLARRLQEQGAATPIVLMSADEEAGRAAPDLPFLPKPFDLARLRELIGQLVEP